MQHGDDYLSYSDDLVKAMSKSTDNVDTMMKLVSDFGDTAENAIVKSGDHAVDIYERFGENGLKAVANYGDDAVMLINRHGEDVIDIINTHGNTAVLIVENYGDDAIKAIKNGIEPKTINDIADWNIKPNEYNKFGITNDTAAKEVAAKGYNHSIVKNEFSSSIPESYVTKNSDVYDEYFKLKKSGLSHQEINDKLLDNMLNASTLSNADKNSVRKAVADAYTNSTRVDAGVTKDLFYDIKNGLVPYDPEVQFPKAYQTWTQKFKNGNDVAYFVNNEIYDNIITRWDALGREAEGAKSSALFVLNADDANAVLNTSNSYTELAQKLGLNDNTFENGAYLIHIDNSVVDNIRFSDVNTLGSNEWWVPGMQTSGGQFEAVISRIEGVVGNNNITFTEVIK